MDRPMAQPVVVPGWLLFSVVVVIAANLVAGAATGISVGVMQGISEFARAVQRHDEHLLAAYRCIAYPFLTGVTLFYLWPLVAYFRCGRATEPSAVVQRRAVNGPFVIAAVGFSGWLSSILVFPVITIVHSGIGKRTSPRSRSSRRS
jgi:hypothetical protein